MKDLIVAVADSYQEKVLEALLPRIPHSSSTAPFNYEIIRNPGKDSGSYNDSHELLRPFINQYKYALVIFDFEGTGVEHLTRQEVENNVQSFMDKNGWEGRNAVIVIQPELETWMWMNNANVEQAIGWESDLSLYNWARQEGLMAPDANKPKRPKETLEKAMRLSGTPLSASIYKNIAQTVSYRKCEDGAFNDLIQQFKNWFPLTPQI